MAESLTDFEILSPAGDLVRLKAAVDFGADAVYLAGKEFGMRTSAPNFELDELSQGINYAHEHGAAVYVTCNTLPHDDEMERLPQYIEQLAALLPDGIIASDLGTMQLIKKHAPNVPLHISVQTGIVNYQTANAFYEMGAKRVVLARELSLEEIKNIRKNTPPDLELEAFCHGAMCVSFSGRCLLSSYMTGRDANRGDCAQPCRWSYALMEETRPGQYFPVSEHKEGTYILNADDLYMAPYLDKMRDCGITSFKIEGRAKSHYYVAAVTNAYYLAKQALLKGEWPLPEAVAQEFNKISHRGYSTGFYFGKPENSQGYKTAGYVRDYFVAAIVEDYADGMIIAKMKNRFSVGAQLDCLEPKSLPKLITVEKMLDENNQPIQIANHPEMIVKIPSKTPLKRGSLLRIKDI